MCQAVISTQLFLTWIFFEFSQFFFFRCVSRVKQKLSGEWKRKKERRRERSNEFFITSYRDSNGYLTKLDDAKLGFFCERSREKVISRAWGGEKASHNSHWHIFLEDYRQGHSPTTTAHKRERKKKGKRGKFLWRTTKQQQQKISIIFCLLLDSNFSLFFRGTFLTKKNKYT